MKPESVTSNQEGADARSRLRAISGSNGPTSFDYDAGGRRTRQQSSTSATEYLYDINDAVERRNSATGASTTLHSLEVDEPLVDGDRVLLTDALGSIVAVTDSSGTLVARYDYDPFGASAMAADTPFQFTSRERDTESGLYYYRARYYAPEFRRFISEDPLGLVAGPNLYAYVGNNPLTNRDPFGLQGATPAPGVAFGPPPVPMFHPGTAENNAFVKAHVDLINSLANKSDARSPGKPIVIVNSKPTNLELLQKGKELSRGPNCELIYAARLQKCEKKCTGAVSNAACRAAAVAEYLICKGREALEAYVKYGGGGGLWGPR